VNRPQQTLGSITLRNWRLRPSSPAIIFEGRAITHCEFAERSFRLANTLRKLGDTVHTEVTIASTRIVSDGRRGAIARTIRLVKHDGTVAQKGLAELLVELKNDKST
jgi:hypothetical protein